MKGRESGMPVASHWQTFFDAPAVLRRLLPQAQNLRVLEFGTGYGTFAFPIVEMGHHLVGFDIEDELVEVVQTKAAEGGLPHLRIQRRDFLADGTGELDEAFDHALLYNILHIEKPEVMLREAWRILKPGATASVIHWRSDIETPRGPSLSIRPTIEQCAAWGLQAGFEKARPVTLEAAAPYHYGLILVKALE
jgi:2-polyprenyl-3-methyl-5-hydroxy-6-metoxy-1,4-benzoquinol methylase